MDIEHVATLSSSRGAGGKVPVAVSVVRDHLRVACPGGDGCNVISLLQQHLPTAAQVLVTTNTAIGHAEPVQALEFSPRVDTLLLCSASSSKTLLWDVDSLLGEGEWVWLGKVSGCGWGR